MSIPATPLENTPEVWDRVGMNDAFKQRKNWFEVAEGNNRRK